MMGILRRLERALVQEHAYVTVYSHVDDLLERCHAAVDRDRPLPNIHRFAIDMTKDGLYLPTFGGLHNYLDTCLRTERYPTGTPSSGSSSPGTEGSPINIPTSPSLRTLCALGGNLPPHSASTAASAVSSQISPASLRAARPLRIILLPAPPGGANSTRRGP
jgi:hypothetical protein